MNIYGKGSSDVSILNGKGSHLNSCGHYRLILFFVSSFIC